jgi:hypothetical protein
MKIEADARQDVPLDEDVAESVTGGRKKSSKAKKPASAVVTSATVVPPAAPAAAQAVDVPNTPLPISPFGDDCIPAEDATNAGTST